MFFELIDVKDTSGKKCRYATKFFTYYEIEMRCLRSAKAGEMLEVGKDISLKLQTPAQLEPLVSNIIDRISYILQNSNLHDSFKKNWWHLSNLSLLIIDNTDKSKLVIRNSPNLVPFCKVKEQVTEGQYVTNRNIMDIVDTTFDENGIDIDENSQMYFVRIQNNIAYIFVDLNHGKDLTLNSNSKNIAKMMRYQTWHGLYTKKYSIPKDWFPFLEIIPDISNNSYDDFEAFILSIMTNERVEGIAKKLTNSTLFNDRIKIINQGMSAFCREEYCNCISNLACQIDGLLRDVYSKQKTVQIGIKTLIDDLIDNIKLKINEDEDHLFFYKDFENFLSVNGFAKNFSETDTGHKFSRHTVAHGKLKYDQYSKLEAIKLILTIDQIYHCSI